MKFSIVMILIVFAALVLGSSLRWGGVFDAPANADTTKGYASQPIATRAEVDHEIGQRASQRERPLLLTQGKPIPRPSDRIGPDGKLKPFGTVWNTISNNEPYSKEEALAAIEAESPDVTPETPPVDIKPDATFEKREVKRAAQSVFIVLNADDLSQAVVVGDNGEWMTDVKEFDLQLKIGKENAVPTVKCTMYRGLFKPSNPEVLEWKVARILTADPKQFQSVIDNLTQGKLPSLAAK